jgi:hypothetical protein
MSTGLIIAIVVIALLLIGLFVFVLPRARQKAQVKARERELGQRREQVVEEHRGVAGERERHAEAAERKAREARAEAEMHKERAELHQRGMADDELVEDHEREHFAPALDRDPEDRENVDTDTGADRDRTAGEPGRFERGPADERTGSRREP